MNRNDYAKFEKEIERRKNTLTKKEAKKRLQAAGIMDKKGNITEPYKEVFTKIK